MLRKVNFEVPSDRLKLQVLPFKEIRIDSYPRTDFFPMLNNWTPYSPNHGVLSFRIACSTAAHCETAVAQMRTDAESVLADVTVHFNVKRSTGRNELVYVGHESLMASETYARVNSAQCENTAVFMQPHELKKMTQEIARSAVDSLEDKFVSYEQVGHWA